ncbi:MAG: TrkA family potassium uptake protein [Haloquadratum sp.]
MYVIVVGAGQIGEQVIKMLTRSEHDVVVIETDTDVATKINQAYDCFVLNTDATVRENLEEAGAADADAIICTTDEDATNIMVLLLAKELEIPSLVTVVQNPEHMSIVRRIGANVLENPQQLIAEHLVRAVQRPSVKDVLHLAGDAEIFEVTVVEGASIAGTTIQEADEEGLIGEDVLIVAIERGDEVVTPKGETRIKPGDLVTVFSRVGITQGVMDEFTNGQG